MINPVDCLVDTQAQDTQNKDFNRVAKIHKYWSRKPFHLIESCILRYSKENDLVVDPFCGSGSTGIGSTLNKRRYIGYDLNPIAIFISDCTLSTAYDEKVFKKEIESLKSEIFDNVMSLYSLGNDRYLLYSLPGKNTKDYNAVTTDYCFANKDKVWLQSDLLHPEVSIPEDLQYPDMPFPKKFYKDRFSYKGIKMVSDMFSKRNLYALAILFNFIKNSNYQHKNLLMLAFSNTILHVSKLKSENVRPLSVNNYWVPDDNIEENVIWRFLDRVNNIVRAKEQIMKRAKSIKTDELYELRNKSSLELEDIEDNTVDYIITDPPYGETIQYSELSYIWNCWIGREFNIEQEVIINPVQNKKVADFQSQIAVFIENTYRVLKPNAAFTLCFQNKDPHIWIDIITCIRNAGFALEDIKIYDTFGSPYNKHWSKFSPKADLYVTFKKTTFVPENFTQITTEQIIDDIVEMCKGMTLNNNKCYDLFVAAVIDAVFEGKEILDIKKWTLKRIVTTYEEKFRTLEE